MQHTMIITPWWTIATRYTSVSLKQLYYQYQSVKKGTATIWKLFIMKLLSMKLYCLCSVVLLCVDALTFICVRAQVRQTGLDASFRTTAWDPQLMICINCTLAIQVKIPREQVRCGDDAAFDGWVKSKRSTKDRIAQQAQMQFDHFLSNKKLLSILYR